MSDELLGDEEQSADIPQGGAGILDGMEALEEKSELDKIFTQMLDPKNIYHFTELNQGEITGFSTLGVIAEKYLSNGVVHKWLLANLQMRVSKQRKGKAEFVKISQRTQDMQQSQPQRGGWNLFR